MAIKLDRSSCTVLAWCTECPEWAALEWSLDGAYAAACRHETAAHPRSDLMRKAAAERQRRAAQRAILAKGS